MYVKWLLSQHKHVKIFRLFGTFAVFLFFLKHYGQLILVTSLKKKDCIQRSAKEMCHADTHPFFFITRRTLQVLFVCYCWINRTANGFCKLKILQVLLIVLVGVQSLALVFVLKTNLKSVSTFQTSFKIFPQLDRNFHKSLKKFVSGPLLNSIEEVGQHFSEICCVQYTGAYFLEGPKSNT